MKILFVNAIKMSFDHPNYCIGQLILKNLLAPNYEVELIDFDLMNFQGTFQYGSTLRESIFRMGDYLLQYKASVISFYTMCDMFHVVCLLTSYLKRHNPSLTIIWAGPQATLLAEECLRSFPDVDMIARGEGENSIITLMSALEKGKSLSGIAGISYRSGKQIIHSPDSALVQPSELHRYTVYDYEPYCIQELGCVELEGGRGCPFSCTFCATKTFWQQKFRVKPVNDLIKEMDTFYQMYKIQNFVIIHDMFTANRQYIMDFCNAVRDRNYYWSCSSRLDTLDSELIKSLQKAGCVGIYIGLETGSQRMQRLLNKHLQLDTVLQKIDLIRSNAISVTVSFMYGFLEEDDDDVQATLRLVQSLLERGIFQIQMHQFIPLPKTAETDKVFDHLVFYPEQIDSNVVLPQYLDDDSIHIIRQYPQIFTSYYTFNTEVKDRYKYLDALAILFNKNTLGDLQKLLTRDNLVQLYLRNRHIFKTIHDKLSTTRRSELRAYCIQQLQTSIDY